MRGPLLLLSNVIAGPEGRIDAELRGRIFATLRKHAGAELDIEIRAHRKNRSLAQNAWLWGCAYPLIAEEIGYDRHEHDELHYWLVATCFGTHFDERLGADVPNARSSKLTTKEFGDYMEWLVRFAAQKWNCVIPLPDEDSGASLGRDNGQDARRAESLTAGAE